MPTQEDFMMALSIAQEAYASKEPGAQAERCGSAWEPSGEGPEGSGSVVVTFLGTPYVIQGPGGAVRYRHAPGEQEPALWEKIIVLHYFNRADGSPLAGTWISVKEIPDSRLYLPNFEKRAVRPLLGRFGGEPEAIRKPAEAIGGTGAELGDVSVTVPVFSRVPITLVFWKGDEEFEPRLQILFDRTIVNYLPTEDIILASQMLAFRLIGLAGRG